MTKDEVVQKCNQYHIKNYIINDDMSIDVGGSVDLFYMYLTVIPLKFNIVCGSFLISYNQLTSLKYGPKRVDCNFNCSHNKLVNYDYLPEYIGNNFLSVYNEIKTRQNINRLTNDGGLTTDNLWKF